MNKKLLCAALAMCFLFSMPVIVVASNLDIFLERCGSCHKTGGKALAVSPADKAGVVWGKYFKRDRHPGDLHESINSEDMANVLTFLQNHAADSEHPVAAIIPK